MPDSNNSWTDKAKGLAIICGLLLACFLAWQWQRPKVSPEEIAKLEAAKIKAENSLKESQAAKAEKDKKIAVIENEKAALIEKSKRYEKELVGRDKIVELLKSQSAEDQAKVLEQFDIYEERHKNDQSLLANAYAEIDALKFYIAESDKNTQSLNEQLQAALQEIQDCQKKRTGKVISFGPGGGVNASGEFTWGFFVILDLGGY